VPCLLALRSSTSRSLHFPCLRPWLRLTLRSRGQPTAGHDCSLGLHWRRRRLPLTSTVRTQEDTFMRYLLALFIAFGLSACASTYKQEVVTSPNIKLERGKAVLIATPKNGAYDKKEYQASGRQTAIAVQSAFARFSDRVVVSSRCSDLPCLQSEGAGGYTYFVVPEILHWEDRNTEWSGMPDRVEVKIVVADSRSNTEVASIVISGKSKWATFGGDHPQDLLPEPIKQYIESLY
jgi:hypothetical protein